MEKFRGRWKILYESLDMEVIFIKVFALKLDVSLITLNDGIIANYILSSWLYSKTTSD